MGRRSHLEVESLLGWLEHPARQARQAFHQIDELAASFFDPEKPIPNRQQTQVAVAQKHFLLVDEFHSDRLGSYSLSFSFSKRLSGGRLRYIGRDRHGPFALHPLGDYTTEHSGKTLTFNQRLANGRFMVALTRDPDATVRVLNGWAVEFRGENRTCHVLHSNRSGKMRALGPVQTDARIAVASWPSNADWRALAMTDLTVHAVNAAQMKFNN